MGKDIHILRIDAGATSSALTAEQLEHAAEDLSVRTATTASEAREAIATTAVDCIVCDADGAAMRGLDLLTELRDQQPSLALFLVVDADSEATVGEALSAGVTDCLTHETDPALVAARIRNAVAAARASHRYDAVLTAGDANYQSLVEDVLNISSVGTFILDAEFSVVWLNDSIEQYFGVDRAAVIGRDKRTLITETLKHRFDDPEGFARQVLATYDDNSYVEQFECHVQASETREGRWLEHRSFPITTGPYQGGRSEHYLDITARKQHEEALEAERQLLDRLVETSPVGLALLDPDGQIVRANTRGEAVLGVSNSNAAELRYDDPNWQISDEDGHEIASEALPFARVLQTGEPVFDYEHSITLSDGTVRWLSISASPLTTPEGAVERVVCAIVDMTEIRESERELERHNERLVEFADIVSHDLRNPLNVIAGSLELADETGDEAHFERSRRAISRMEQLIDDLLSLAKTGEEIDHTEAVDMGRLSVECWQHLSTEAATLLIETEQLVTADRSRLTQLLENLFRNSVEHGGAAVTITVGELADGFFVADDGPGIAPADRERIFERGYSSTRGGTGLGLSIVSQIAEAHGWEVALADADTGGLRIELTGVELLDAEAESGPEQTDQSQPSTK